MCHPVRAPDSLSREELVQQYRIKQVLEKDLAFHRECRDALVRMYDDLQAGVLCLGSCQARSESAAGGSAPLRGRKRVIASRDDSAAGDLAPSRGRMRFVEA